MISADAADVRRDSFSISFRKEWKKRVDEGCWIDTCVLAIIRFISEFVNCLFKKKLLAGSASVFDMNGLAQCTVFKSAIIIMIL